MKRTHFALACASALLLSSCFNKNGDGPSRPSIPPRSLLAGKVEMRTTTLLDASSKAIGRIEETFGKQGERLRRDSSELNGTTPTLRFSKVYHRDKTGYLSSIATHRITTAGEEKREETFTYNPYGEGVRLLTAQTLYDGAKNKLTETIISVVDGRVPILKYCGGNNTAAVVEEIKQTNWKGIDGILSICPYYNKPSQEGLYQHFKAIAKTSPLPIVLYNVPGRTGVNMKAETTVRIANDFPNIVAIKEAAGSLEQVDEIIKNKPKHFEVISGDDALTFPMIASGAVGVISVIGNALPKEFSRMIRLEFNGEYDAARIIHHQFTELYKLLFVDGNPAGCKALLNDMGMIENVLRLPLVPTRIETKQKMNDILKKMRLS